MSENLENKNLVEQAEVQTEAVKPKKTWAWIWVPFTLLVYFFVNVIVVGIHMNEYLDANNIPFEERTTQNIQILTKDYLVENSLPMTFQMQAICIILFALIFWFISRRYQFNFGFKKKLSKKEYAELVPLTLLLIFATNLFMIAVKLLANFIPALAATLENYDQHMSLLLKSDPVLLILTFTSVVIGAPVMEELLFRGIIYGSLRKHIRPLFAVLIAAFIFGLVHGQPIQVIYATLLGLSIGLVMMKYQSIKVAIVMHMIFNFVGGFVPTLLGVYFEDEHPVVIAYGLMMFAFYIGLAIVYRKELKKLPTTVKEILAQA